MNFQVWHATQIVKGHIGSKLPLKTKLKTIIKLYAKGLVITLFTNIRSTLNKLESKL